MPTKPRLEDKMMCLGTKGMCPSEEEYKMAGLSLCHFLIELCSQWFSGFHGHWEVTRSLLSIQHLASPPQHPVVQIFSTSSPIMIFMGQ